MAKHRNPGPLSLVAPGSEGLSFAPVDPAPVAAEESPVASSASPEPSAADAIMASPVQLPDPVKEPEPEPAQAKAAKADPFADIDSEPPATKRLAFEVQATKKEGFWRFGRHFSGASPTVLFCDELSQAQIAELESGVAVQKKLLRVKLIEV